MTRIALLVGVSNYHQEGFADLPTAIRDVEGLKAVLQQPEVGQYQVTTLLDPDRLTLEKEIDELYANRQPDDVVIFYFSGHGITDSEGQLYLTTPQAETDNRGIKDYTVVSGEYLKGKMEKSRSKYQVVILDCCFSGAIAKGLLAKGVQDLNITDNLGGRGRAILTATTATQLAFAEEGSEFSLYSKHIIEGLKTGDAEEENENGWITPDSLHHYVSERVQQALPEMTPKLYPVAEGYKIHIAKSPKQQTLTEFAPERGLILLADIVDFSELRGSVQIQVISNLWEFIRDNLPNHDARPPIVDGYLDRVVVAFPISVYQKILDFASKLIRHMRQKQNVDLRIGIHVGAFQCVEKPTNQSTHLIGLGPNHCARITEIGDAGHIIVSEQFVDAWREEFGDVILSRLTPQDSPIFLFYKSGSPKRIRIYRPPGIGEIEVKVPQRLVQLQIAEKQLKEIVLSEIEEVFMQLVDEKDQNLDWERVRPRISLLAPAPNDPNELFATEFRYLRRPDPGTFSTQSLIRRGQVAYKLAEPGQGTAARAFISQSPQVLYGLPSYEDSPEDYIQRLAEWNLPEDIVRSLSRHARAFISFPFMLAEGERPDGVITIDTWSGLTSEYLSKEDLLEFAEYLMSSYGLLIAALWRLRV